MNDSSGEGRLLDLARRLLAGEAIDWAKEGVAEEEVREGMGRLEKIVGRPGRSTETRDSPPPELPPPPPPPPSVNPKREDRFIGDFRIVRKLGEGGMGVVYEAEQQHPRRPVALKVIRGGAHVSPDTLKLFQREAQTLAHLRHPGIAALYETGATEDGLHFFAMELVRGSTLTAWLGQRPAGPRTPHEVRLRLSVFKKICDAVAYAHQRGVIHRDLKPANVLIPKVTAGSSMQDEVPNVKILDFGLARITDSDVQAATYVTEMGKIQGTLPYMSPEQVRGNPDEIDLRTDVYSLGVMLYEIVTGTLPYDIAKAQIPEAVRIICEQPPRSISASFSGTRHLDADVITIAGKCLEKEPSRRYQSAAALGEDVQRYLTDQPILARPPSAIYQFKKLAARHRGAVAFVATVFVLVTVLAVTSTIQAVRVAKERDRANQEAEAARRVSAFMEELFTIPDPSEARGRTVTAREILDRGAERIERELNDQPATKARLLSTMAMTYSSLGLLERSGELQRLSARIDAEVYGTDSVEYAAALVEQCIGGPQGDLDARLKTARDALTVLSAKLPPDDLRRLKAMYAVGATLNVLGQLEESRRVLQAGLSQLESSRSPDDRLRIWFLNDLGTIAVTQGQLQEAQRWYERAQEYRDRLYPEEHPDRNIGLSNLGDLFLRLGQRARARELFERALRNFESVYGPDNLALVISLANLGEVNLLDGRLDEAHALVNRALEIYEKNGLRRTKTAPLYLVLLARVQEAEGNIEAAEATLREAIDIATGTSGYDSAAQIDAIDLLARLLRRTGRAGEADTLDRRAQEIRRKTGLASSPQTGGSVPSTRIEARSNQ